MKLGSLFDGSGGFPLAGAMCGFEPVWAAEVEPYPIAVTTSRFPTMKHLGDVSKVNGAEIEPVDIITFGSPCQDMSVAGKRAGIKHDEHGDEETTRSGLFYEAVRIIKEMRDGTEGRCPTFVIWENVPGAFSSNGGQDFRTVLEELVKIVEPQAVMPDVPKGGWAYADCYRGDGWSLAYRVFDAQHIRTAQRRKRIYLVLDLGGQRALQILAQRDRLRRNTPQGGEARKATPSDAQRGVGADDREGEAPYTLKIRSGCDGGGKGALVPLDKSATLATNNDQYLFHPVGTDPYNGCLTCPPSSTLGVNCGLATGRTGVITLEPGVAAREGGHIYEGVSGTLRANAGDNQMAVAYAVENHPADSQAVSFNWQAAAGAGLCVEENCVNPLGCTRVPAVACGINGETAGTLDASYFKGCGERSGVEREVIATYGFDPSADRDVGALFIEECSKTITNGTSPGHHEGAVIAIDRAAFNQGANALYDFEIGEHGVNSTIVAKGPSAVAYKEPPHYIVRRLTPTECARLQGFPDRWGDINTKDSMTDEDFRFWLEVRQTYDRINGRAAKDYTPTQVLTWYNKLHTDSAEYKMWGNGIALPCALYVMEGIEEAYHEV